MLLTIFNAGAAGSQNIETLIILRFLAGAFGSSPLTNAGGVIAGMPRYLVDLVYEKVTNVQQICSLLPNEVWLRVSLLPHRSLGLSLVQLVSAHTPSRSAVQEKLLTICSWRVCWPIHRMALDRRRHGYLHRRPLAHLRIPCA